MTFVTLGLVPVPTAGTPVPLSTDPTVVAARIVVSQNPGTTGKVYLKNIKGSAAGVLVRAFLPPGASGFTDEHELHSDGNGDQLRPADWAIDSQNNNEGLVVYWVQE